MAGRRQPPLDWEKQAQWFDPDGALRDIYVLKTGVAEWERVVRMILDGPYDSRLTRDDAPLELPASVNELFVTKEDQTLSRLAFTVGGILLHCHFFTSEEIEFDLDPRQVTEQGLESLFAFMAALGDLTGKQVVLCVENMKSVWLAKYETAVGWKV